jgi:hypothetical protein
MAKPRLQLTRECQIFDYVPESMLEIAGFTAVQTSVVDKEPDMPQFQTLLAAASKAC